MKFIQKLVFGAGVLGLWLVAPYARGDVTLTTLVSFDGFNGSEPWGALVQGVDGDFYSTTRDAPPYRGTVFKITTNGVLDTLVLFNGTNGAAPWNGALVQSSDDNFYGTTTHGGVTYPPDLGTVFRVATNGALTSLHSFQWIDGFSPYGGLVQGTDGYLYGATAWGGTAPRLAGTVFKMSPTGNLTTLVSFNGTNGLVPFSALLRGSDGKFYGTTTQGGESYGNPRSVNGEGFGTVFKMTPDGVLTTLFSFHGTNGSYPYASLAQGSDGNFYGATLSGGAYTNERFPGYPEYAGYGTIFRITPNGALTTLVSFDRTNGAKPLGSLTLGRDGNFYGTTIKGGSFDLGTVFRLSVSAPPTVRCPAWGTAECGAVPPVTVYVNDPDGNVLTVVWTLNGQTVQTNIMQTAGVVFLSGPLLLLGTNTISVSATDPSDNTASCSATIVVVDTHPPVIFSAEANPNVLWPPNHQMVAVAVTARAIDNRCGTPTWKIIQVQSNEPVNGPGDENTAPDWIITGDHTVNLRAERSGSGEGRIYYVTLQATDVSGNVSQPSVIRVTAPKSQGRGK